MKSSSVKSLLACAMFLMCGCSGRFTPYEIENLEPTPDFWRVRPAQIIEQCRNVSVGRSEVICKTPFGYPVYAYFWGDFSESEPQTNWSAGNSSSAIRAYLGDRNGKQTIMFIAGVHGAEPESVAAAVNMIQMFETGSDFRGVEDTAFLNLAKNYRFIIVPCVNMDGRSICPDHLRGQPYEVFRAVCQGTWKDGSLVGWKSSKEWFPLPLDKVSFPGGYPNGDGYNIQHDVAPGDMRTEEAKAVCRLMARWRVDFMLNGHSCEYASHMFAPSIVESARHIERGCMLCDKINDKFLEEGLMMHPRPKGVPSETLNLSNVTNWCSGGLSLTLECSSSYDNIHEPTVCFTFDQLMSPPFVALKVIMEDGLEKPLACRIEGAAL